MAKPPSAQIAVLALWALLAAAQAGWLPPLQYAWAFNLWAYQPPAFAFALAALCFAACWPQLRERAWRGLASLAASLASLPRPVRETLIFAAVVSLLWLVRERTLFGDSRLLFVWARGAERFVFPDIGATFLLRSAVEAGPWLGIRSADSVGLFICALGGVAFGLLRVLARALAPADRPAAHVWILALLATGGWVRLYAGHFEVYAPLMLGVLSYLVLALARLRGRVALWAPALALGVCGWLHAVSILLVPSMLWLLWKASDGSAAFFRQTLLAGFVALAPLAAFVGACLAFGATAELEHAVAKALQVMGRDPEPDAIRWWVRGWGGAASVGTDVVFLSLPHLKYVANAAWILMPFAAPGTLLLWWFRRRAGASGPDPRASLLLFASLPFVAYAFSLRPFWGPWDWDLFSLAGITGGAWLAHRLAAVLPAAALREWAGLLVAFQLCFVSVPFLAAGVSTSRDAGPFAEALFELQTARPMTPPGPRLAPWL